MLEPSSPYTARRVRRLGSSEKSSIVAWQNNSPGQHTHLTVNQVLIEEANSGGGHTNFLADSRAETEDKGHREQTPDFA